MSYSYNTSTSSTSSSRVVLLVYDLSQGMARALSQSILGRQIDGIWHTGVLFNGHEYYFGGGINCDREGYFAQTRGMYPVQQIDLGVSTRTSDDVRTFLGTIRHRFTAQAYDLIRNNCNNFSNEVSSFEDNSYNASYWLL